VIDVRIAGDEIESRLRTSITAMQGFRSVIDKEINTPETPPGATPDLRVLAYWVLYFGGGQLNSDRAVPGLYVSSLTFTVTVAAGTEDRCLWGIEQVRDALAGVELASGLISEVEQDLGSLRVDRGVDPPRQFVPLNFRLEP
jgi:hypothetical protein